MVVLVAAKILRATSDTIRATRDTNREDGSAGAYI
jgi:hypothetical protein